MKKVTGKNGQKTTVFNKYEIGTSNSCPECRSLNIEQLRRVTGYLTTDYRKFNTGKQDEVLKRFKHSRK